MYYWSGLFYLDITTNSLYLQNFSHYSLLYFSKDKKRTRRPCSLSELSSTGSQGPYLSQCSGSVLFDCSWKSSCSKQAARFMVAENQNLARQERVLSDRSQDCRGNEEISSAFVKRTKLWVPQNKLLAWGADCIVPVLSHFLSCRFPVLIGKRSSCLPAL